MSMAESWGAVTAHCFGCKFMEVIHQLTVNYMVNILGHC